MLDSRTRTLALLGSALALLTLLSLAGMVGPDRVLAAPHRGSLLLPVDVHGQLERWRTERARASRGALDADAAQAYQQVLGFLERRGAATSPQLPELRRMRGYEGARAAIRDGARFQPFARPLDVVRADPWLDRAALLGHRLEQASNADAAPVHALEWCVVALHLGADLRRLGALPFLEASAHLERSTVHLLTAHARSWWRQGREWEALLETLGRVRYQGATREQVARAEALVAMGTFLGVADVRPFDELRRHWGLGHPPPPEPAVRAGFGVLLGYQRQVERLLEDLDDARQRWIYAQWSAELARQCPEASLVIGPADQFRHWNGSTERLLGLEVALRLTARRARTGAAPATADELLAELAAADPDLPDDLETPDLEWSADGRLLRVNWSSTAGARLRAAARRVRTQ